MGNLYNWFSNMGNFTAFYQFNHQRLVALVPALDDPHQPGLESTQICTRPGKHTKNDGTSPFFMGKLAISMAMFNSKLLVLPEGR
jgi:hypothetical protein